MDEREKKIRQKLKDDFVHYAAKCLRIRTKSGEILPFILNKGQTHIHQKIEEQKRITGRVRVIICKGRQLGSSTYASGRMYHNVTHHYGVRAFILTHEKDATDNLFEMSQRFHDNVPILVKPRVGASSAKELYFDVLDSGYKIGTAGNKATGRSSTVQYLLGCLSEDSLIILADGSTKTIKDISIGDLVITSSGAIAPVKNKIFTGIKDTYCFESWLSGEPIYLTEDHKILTECGYKELKDVNLSDYIAMPKIELTDEIKTYSFVLKNMPRKQGGGCIHIGKHDFQLNFNFGYFLGYYLAEGHIKDNFGYITFTYNANENYIEKALKGIDGLPTSISHKVETFANRKRTMIYGKFITSAIHSICGRVDDKKIPEWIFKTNKDFVEGIINGYLDGDGSKSNIGKIAASSIHEKISRQIQRLCLAIYGASSVKKKLRARYGKPSKDIFLFTMSGNTLKKYKKTGKYRKGHSYIKDNTVYCQIKSISYRKREPVWDIEIDHQDHNFQTTAGIVSNSEVAYWPNAAEHAKGVLQAVPNENGTEIILESTANGIGNYFHEQWQLAEAGASDFLPIFVPWYWMPEYRRELPDVFNPLEDEIELIQLYGLDAHQLTWRRYKIQELSAAGGNGAKAFQQEYPMNAIEAFVSSGEDTLIDAALVMRARKAKCEAYGPLVVGCDPARFGDDRTSIIYRRGRMAYNLKSYLKKDTMEVAGILHKIILTDRPDKVFVDVGGLGAGIIDRLNELGHAEVVVPVNAGSSPLDQDLYSNKRAEMWGECKKWLQQIPVQIPDEDSLHADLTSVKYKYDSLTRLVIEPKEQMKKRGLRSPDEAESLILTFAQPVESGSQSKRKSEDVARQIMSASNRLQQVRSGR